MKRLVALYRNPTYSPAMHRRNDTAILDSTVDELEHRGWNVTRSAEGDVAAGRLPDADLYVNMCQGPAASERLLTRRSRSIRRTASSIAIATCS